MQQPVHPFILWDIDGTLVRGNKLIATLFLQALSDVYGIGEPQRVDYGGKTDQQIVTETLALHGLSASDTLVLFEQWSMHYQHLLATAQADLPHALWRLPGTYELLARLHDMGVPQSLLTGNIAPVALLKLQVVGLAQFVDLEIGAYGSDHHDRNELVPVARRKAAARYGLLDRVVVIGDTPRDIACARAGGARAIAVATGHVSLETLAAHQPDVLLADLCDTAAVIAAITQHDEPLR